MSLADQTMGLGLRALNGLAGLPLLDRLGLREPTERLVHGASKNGFRAAVVAGRTFARAQALTRPSRPATQRRPDLFDLTPTDEQQMLVEATRDFAGARLRPAAQGADDACAAPAELLAEATELGLAALGVPEELGGVTSERSAVTAALVGEAMAHGDLGLAAAILAPGGVATALGLWGDADQQATYLPPFTGEDPPVAAFALQEPRALFDPFALRTTVRRDGGDLVLDGEKALVLRGADAELLLVGADLDDRPVLVVVATGEAEGVTATPEPAMGLRPAATATLRLEGVRVPRTALLADGDPDVYAEAVQRARIAWCALAAGTSRAVLDYVIPYVNERVAFGEPVSHRQGVAFRVSDIAIELEGLRLLTLRAAARADQGLPFAKEAALARAFAAEKATRIGSDGVGLLGGHGYVKEHPVERWYRDLRAAGVLEGALLV